MKSYEFYHYYANTPISDRLRMVNIPEIGNKSLMAIYYRLQAIEDTERPLQIEKQQLLTAVEKYKQNDPENFNRETANL